MSQAPQGNWQNQAPHQTPHANPQNGWQGTPPSQGSWQAPPPGYGPHGGWQHGAQQAPSEIDKIDKDGQTWLIVAIAGWFFGVMWATGPLAWYMAGGLRKRAEELGAEEPSNVKYARIAGMVSTILVIGGVLLTMAFFVFFFGIFGLAAVAG